MISQFGLQSHDETNLKYFLQALLFKRKYSQLLVAFDVQNLLISWSSICQHVRLDHLLLKLSS